MASSRLPLGMLWGLIYPDKRSPAVSVHGGSRAFSWASNIPAVYFILFLFLFFVGRSVSCPSGSALLFVRFFPLGPNDHHASRPIPDVCGRSSARVVDLGDRTGGAVFCLVAQVSGGIITSLLCFP